ncbi:FAD-dependent oxidoreductase [Puniceicoccus vermicola]|uniref:FAD-dependent oxidoreductase n=1 Tax=Puniceicoccus vermicola TaxID=388746 RepID=A0A7X1AZA1_9BACT|nr:FAD-dependent oxidoreductase [Puniceicoccus vermicola]MBC2602725.1 FAD-dependent oxidoreductase [Puniceicoccus vermicola]
MKLPSSSHSRSFDVIVAGGGPAGIAAAIAASRTGAKVLILEGHGCLGGVWTAGALTLILDSENKTGLMEEIYQRLSQYEGRSAIPSNRYDVEVMKWVLDELCEEAGVAVRLHTQVTAARMVQGRLTSVETHSKSGFESWEGKVFIDCTGDGDLGALAGNGFEMGHPVSGEVQPMSLMAIVTGVSSPEIDPYVVESNGEYSDSPKEVLCKAIESGGHSPSYRSPSLFRIHPDVYGLMTNHQYSVRCDDAEGISEATREARGEIHKIVRSLRSQGGAFAGLRLVATAEQIGVREGRRLHGWYRLTVDDLVRGVRFDDAIARATFCVDVHSTNPEAGKSYDSDGVQTQPYDIPLRALVAKNVDGLLMAGRCISGDFWAHASYRVTGNAVAMGEASGSFAGYCLANETTPHTICSDQEKLSTYSKQITS